MLRLPTSTVNGMVESLGTECRRQEIFCRISKFWCRILQVEQELLKCYWQIGSLKLENWVASLREEVYSTGLEYFCQNGKYRDIRVTYQKTINRCNDMGRLK
jgi:hypothetical protein